MATPTVSKTIKILTMLAASRWSASSVVSRSASNDSVMVSRDANKIIVMDAGQIIEQGSHVSLSRGGGVYAGLSQNQSLAKEMEIYL